MNSSKKITDITNSKTNYKAQLHNNFEDARSFYNLNRQNSYGYQPGSYGMGTFLSPSLHQKINSSKMKLLRSSTPNEA